jgi:hypothetical protein
MHKLSSTKFRFRIKNVFMLVLVSVLSGVSYSANALSINSTVVWNTDGFYDEDIHIWPGGSLTINDALIVMGENRQIIVHGAELSSDYGGRLYVNNSTITGGGSLLTPHTKIWYIPTPLQIK